MLSRLPAAPVLPTLRITSNRTVLYYSVCVDLSAVRAIHALEHCPCITDPNLGLNGADCGSVHYGLCSPLYLKPAVDLQPLQTLTPIVAKSESYRDKIQAAIELLATEEEPTDLEAFLRNFVREDRRRQESKQSIINELDSKGAKKIIIRSRPQTELVNNQQNADKGLTVDQSSRNVFGVRKSPDGKDNGNEGLVRSRLSKFDQPIERSRSLSPTAITKADSQLTCADSSLQSSSERIVFGISPKSNSLARYKSLIESRKNSASAQSSNDDNKTQLSDPTVEGPNKEQKQRTIIVRNAPVCGTVPKIDVQSSAQSLPNPPSNESAFAPTISVIDSNLKQSFSSVKSQKSSNVVPTDQQNASDMTPSPSPVKVVTNKSKTITPSAKTSNIRTDSNNLRNGNNKSRPVSAPEGSIEQFIVQQLTDDEKAILQKSSHKSSKEEQMGTKNMNKDQKNRSNEPGSPTSPTATGNGCANKTGSFNQSGGDSMTNNYTPNKPKPSNEKPKPRIITLSKPLPKPEPKPAEPKYVNGKLVFGQQPVKPCLAKGSVAERVMLFEKCPEKTSVTKVKKFNDKNRDKLIYNKVGQWMKLNDNNNTKNETISRRFSRSNSLAGVYPPGQLPKFYYPVGRPYSSHEVESQIRRITSVFDRFPSKIVSRKEFATILKLVGLPVYWKEPLFRAVLKTNNDINTINNNNNNNNVNNGNSNGNGNGTANGTANGNGNGNGNGKKEVISCDTFVDYWKKVITTSYDNSSRFFKIMTAGQRNYLLPEDFGPMIQDVIDTHPGLAFLREAEEFHSRYMHTVIARIFYCVNKSWTGRITLPELRKSNFLQVVTLLEEEDDINQITDYFSYEHFYVIYCKFWELDRDHDLLISKTDLGRHNDAAISSRMIDRIFSGAVTRGQTRKDELMSYSEFVWFLLSEEDKRHPRSIEYWFRCMDIDGDGYLSMYELEYFYSEQTKRMEAIGIEALPFNDCLCQMLDLVRPQISGKISLSDLKRCRLTPIFFDTFFNLEKYLDHEQRDPFASSRDEDGLTMSDWDRYAAEEYELLVAEESAQQNNQNLLDFTGESGLNELMIANHNKNNTGLRPRYVRSDGYTDEDYDYCETDDSDYAY